jgi:hypothetical protein
VLHAFAAAGSSYGAPQQSQRTRKAALARIWLLMSIERQAFGGHDLGATFRQTRTS